VLTFSFNFDIEFNIIFSQIDIF